jgi:chromosome partitioning protein
MQVWAVVSQKGGSGKTTLALHLAAAASAEGRSVLVIDLDPQRSAEKWTRSRDSDVPAIVAGEAAKLPEMLAAAEAAEANLVIIDTAPRMEAAAITAAKQANLVIVTSRATALDIPPALATIEMLELAGRKGMAVVVLNAIPARSAEGSEAAAIFQETDVAVCPRFLAERLEYQRSLTQGLGITEFAPKGKAASELTAVYQWLCSATKGTGIPKASTAPGIKRRSKVK